LVQGENLKEIVRIEGKILLSVLLTILLVTLVHPVVAEGTPVINVDPPHKEVDIAETFTVAINISDVEEPGVYAYEFTLNYDNTLLNVTEAGYPEGHFLEGTYTFLVPVVVDYEEGTVLFGATILGDEPGRTGSGVLATVEFNGTNVGEALLEIEGVTLLDPDGNDLTYTTNDGDVTVIPEFTSALIMLILIVTTSVAMILKKSNLSKKHNIRRL